MARAELRHCASALLYTCWGALLTAGISIPPIELSTAGCYGHIFWDAGTFRFPIQVALDPEMVKSRVMFRYRTPDAARRQAEALGGPVSLGGRSGRSRDDARYCAPGPRSKRTTSTRTSHCRGGMVRARGDRVRLKSRVYSIRTTPRIPRRAALPTTTRKMARRPTARFRYAIRRSAWWTMLTPRPRQRRTWAFQLLSGARVSGAALSRAKVRMLAISAVRRHGATGCTAGRFGNYLAKTLRENGSRN